MSVKLLTERHLGFLGLKGGCEGPSGSALARVPHFESHMSRPINQSINQFITLRLHNITT